jgi:hypothetical protein
VVRIVGSTLALVLVMGGTVWAGDPPTLTQSVETLYRAQKRDKAHTLLASRSGAGLWNQHSGVSVRAVFHSRARGLTIEATRKPQAKGELFVAIPPGTWAQPQASRGHDDPYPQTLLLLEARLLRLAPNQKSARVTLPVACAAFRREGPKPKHGYTLQQAPRGSNMDRLAQVLCAKAWSHERDPELALAIWIAHEQLGYEHLKRSLGFQTFRTPRKKVTIANSRAAAKLLREAGLEPASFQFFRAQGYKAQAKPARTKTKREPAKKQRQPQVTPDLS